MGYEAVVRKIVGRGDVDINRKDQHGRTPLSRAAEREHEEIVRLLVGGGAGINVKSTQGETALLQAASKESTCAREIPSKSN